MCVPGSDMNLSCCEILGILWEFHETKCKCFTVFSKTKTKHKQQDSKMADWEGQKQYINNTWSSDLVA